MSCPRIQIFGHSYVRRLKDYIKQSDNLTFSLNLQQPTLVQYSGFPGASVDRLQQNLDVIQDFQPNLVILIIGTNDLCSPTTTPEQLAADIAKLANNIICIGVSRVLVLPILYRQSSQRPSRYHVDIPWFNERVHQVNGKLADAMKHIERARMWKIKGFWSDEAQTSAFAADGVHLSDEGNRKLYNNIRMAVVSMLNSPSGL